MDDGKPNRNVLRKLGRFVVHSSIELVIKLLWVDDSFRFRCFQDEIGDADGRVVYFNPEHFHDLVYPYR